jgi:hypothetical protein
MSKRPARPKNQPSGLRGGIAFPFLGRSGLAVAGSGTLNRSIGRRFGQRRRARLQRHGPNPSVPPAGRPWQAHSCDFAVGWHTGRYCDGRAQLPRAVSWPR